MSKHAKRSLAALFATLSIALVAGGLVLAKPPGGGGGGGKPGGGDPPAGTVYYVSSSMAWTMNADGSGKLPAVDGEPSRDVHDGYRWFLQLRMIDGEFFPNGDPREEVFAVREGGDEQFTVQLTTDPMVQPLRNEVLAGERPYVHWATDRGAVDGKISFTARRFNGNGDVVEMGIYSSIVAFVDWAPLAFPETLVWDVPAYPADPADPPLLQDVPATGNHTWSPDGAQLAYDVITSEGAIYVVDIGLGIPQLLAAGSDPEWAPDGSLIVFKSESLDVKTIALDGTGESVLVHTTYKGSNYKIAGYPTWSPDSKFVAYGYLVSNNGGDRADVYIVHRSGSGKTNLTNDVDAFAGPTAWR